MNQASIWRDGFLDLSDTQHARDRGEGTARPAGTEIPWLMGWRWGHQASLDHSSEGLLPRGPLPSDWMNYHGYYRHGREVVLSYQIDGRPVLESPLAQDGMLLHRMQIGPGTELKLAAAGGQDVEADEARIIADGGNASRTTSSSAATSIAAAMRVDEQSVQEFVVAAVVGEVNGLTWQADDQKRLVLTIPQSDRTRSIIVLRTSGKGDEAWQRVVTELKTSRAMITPRLRPMTTEGGPLLWPEEIATVGFLGLESGGYALDTLTLPDKTPWNTWFRTSALDFFPDGRMALATYGGDIWIVSGIDHDLKQLRWKRFAAGLYEPFGVKVVDDQVHVACKDRLIRLHDLNEDGEADFYESFSADTDVSVNFHAFSFDLQTDNDGNFYYAKSGHGSDSDLPGAIIKVSSDGKTREVYSTGFRTPNGMGMLPDGRPTVSDNQGQWMPASKINLLRPGGFYGWVPTYSIPGMWSPGGGTIDLDEVEPPQLFDQPIVWMPQDFDNSSGGQLWVDDPRFGPLAGHLLHTSFGKGWMSYLMMQEVDGVAQGAIIKLPFDFRTGIMRARVNPLDGQVHATGLQGWNGGGRIGLLDSGVQRLRFTGNEDFMVIDCQVTQDGLRIAFNDALDADASTNPDAYTIEVWNYQWRREYGSDQFSPTTGEVGIEKWDIESVSLGSDGRSIKLSLPDLIPVDQLHLRLRVKSQKGTRLDEEIYWTIHRVPKSR
jgi:sugar lactone lactonase YvrE